MDESFHDHDMRIKLLERNCDQCPDKFSKVFQKLEEIQNAIVDLRLSDARSNGFKTALLGAGGGGAVLGAVKLVGYLFK